MRTKQIFTALFFLIGKAACQFEPNVPNPGVSSEKFWNQTGWEMCCEKEAKPLEDIKNIILRRLNVFIPDGRKVMSNADMQTFPINTVGVVKETSFCTGTLIARDVVLTNRHCVKINSEGKLTGGFLNNGYFYLSWHQNKWHRRSGFTNESVISANSKQDWALLVLKQPLGDDVGWVGMKNKEKYDYFAQKDRLVNMISYSGDYVGKYGRGGFQRNCSTRGVWNNHAIHDCDATRGSSGSAILEGWGKPYVIGVNYAEFRYPSSQSQVLDQFTQDRSNVFDPSESFYKAFHELRGPPTPSPTPAPEPCWKFCKKFKKRRACNAQKRSRCGCKWMRVSRKKHKCRRS